MLSVSFRTLVRGMGAGYRPEMTTCPAWTWSGCGALKAVCVWLPSKLQDLAVGGGKPLFEFLIEAFQADRVHMHEVEREDAASLRGEELFPCRPGPARSRFDARSVEDLPHCRGGDLVAELHQLALGPAMAPRRIILRHRQNELLHRRGGRRPTWFPPGAVVPLTGNQPTVPASSIAGLTGNTSAQRRRGISDESATNLNRSAGS